MKNYFSIFAILSSMLLSCIGKNNETGGTQAVFTGEADEVRLIVLAPGHFHANLLQKSRMEQVNDSVFVYASGYDAGLQQYLAAIESFNQRDAAPTRWEEAVYTGEDFLERMVADKKGNVVVLAGNNRDKTEYILTAVDAGIHVLSDKPMAINQEDFHLLEEAYNNAEAGDVLLYDMMTERYDMLNISKTVDRLNEWLHQQSLRPVVPRRNTVGRDRDSVITKGHSDGLADRKTVLDRQ